MLVDHQCVIPAHSHGEWVSLRVACNRGIRTRSVPPLLPCCRKYRPQVVLEDTEPFLHVGGVAGPWLGRDSERGAHEGSTQFRDQLLERRRHDPRSVHQHAIEAVFGSGPVDELMDEVKQLS